MDSYTTPGGHVVKVRQKYSCQNSDSHIEVVEISKTETSWRWINAGSAGDTAKNYVFEKAVDSGWIQLLFDPITELLELLDNE